MTEATMDSPENSEAAALVAAARALDVARIKQLGSYHFAMVAGALTLWGAAEAWAQSTGWALAHLVAIANAFVAGYVVPSTIHEWGHFAGARLSGATSPALEAPRRHFFMFDFPMDQNDVRQFTWMSWGGILAPWVAVLLLPMLVPLGSTSSLVLLSVLVFKAVGAGVFEIPIVRAAQASGEPGAALGERVRSGGLDQGRRIGMIAGVACFLLAWVIV